MTYDEHRTRGELEEAQRDESATARRRIEQADEYVSYYRTRMRSLEEGFYELASRFGATDDPRLRSVYAQVSSEVDENVRAAGAVVVRLDEDYRELQSRHAGELETFQGKN
ncbi:hypothetical protein ACFQ9V_14160 [Leifsonia sp. NPDC056665]|uniref:hypothetical protein n=1 Tax=Leifsonia sp. NPDC056665 TaxID=3345901 RepID=UPI003698E8EB